MKQLLFLIAPKFSKLRFVSFYLNSREYRTKLSLIFGFILNLSFSIFKFVTGIIYHSLWFGAVGVYYFLLSILRIITFKSIIDIMKIPKAERETKEHFVGRIVGVFLLLLGLAMGALVFKFIYNGRTLIYPTYIIIILTIFAIYRLIAAINSLLRFKSNKQTLFTIAKSIDLASVFMAILSVQTAVLTRIGVSDNLAKQLDCLIGIAICGTIILIAIYIIKK